MNLQLWCLSAKIASSLLAEWREVSPSCKLSNASSCVLWYLSTFVVFGYFLEYVKTLFPSHLLISPHVLPISCTKEHICWQLPLHVECWVAWRQLQEPYGNKQCDIHLWILEYGRKFGYPEGSQTDTRRTSKLHAEKPWLGSDCRVTAITNISYIPESLANWQGLDNYYYRHEDEDRSSALQPWFCSIHQRG